MCCDVCSLLYCVLCAVRCVLCAVLCAVRCVPCVVCRVLCAVCRVLYVVCSVSLKRTNVGGGTPSSPSSAQSWLVDAYRHCNATKINTRGPAFPSDVVCPNATAVAAFNEAVRRGDITYHAFPFNAEPELFTPELFDAALNLTFAQDAFYGHPKRRTLSQRVSRSWRRWGGSCVNVCVCVCVCVCVWV